MTILIDLAAGNHTVLEVVFDRVAAVDRDLDHLSFLRTVGKLEFILRVIQNVALVRTALLQVIAAQRQVGTDRRHAVIIKGHDLNEPTCRNDVPVAGNQVSLGIQTEGDVFQLAVHTDAEQLILLQHLAQGYFDLLALVIEITGSFRNGDLLTGVSQLHRLDCAVQNHSVRCGDFPDLIFSEIQFLARCYTVRPGRDRIHDLALCVMHDTVKRINIFCCTDLKHCAGQTLDRIDRFIDPVRFRDRPEYFAGLSDADDAFLRHVGTGDFNQCDAAVLGRRVCGHIKIDRIRVQYIAIRGIDLHNGVPFSERKNFRSDQIALLVGVEGVDCRQLRVGILHSDSGAVWVIDLERRTCIRDTQTRFRIRLLDLEISGKGGIVEQILIAASVFINENIERRC